MKHKVLIIAAIAAFPMLISSPAKAERCRTYSKAIYIDGHREVGYGKACRVERGVWEIVKISGTYKARERVRERIYEDLYDRYDDKDTRVVIIDRDHDYYDRDRYDYGYHAARYYSATPYYHSKYKGHAKKYYKHTYKHSKHVHYHGGKKCNGRH